MEDFKEMIAFMAASLLMIIYGLAFATYDIITYEGVLLYFTVFDGIGYWYLVHNDGHNNYSFITEKYYRILQISQMVILIMLMWGRWELIAASIFAWWFGFCDLMFYVILKQTSMLKWKNMTWLWWTPYGLINKLFGWNTSGKQLLYFGLFGFIAGLIYLII